VRGDSALTPREAEPVIAAYLHALERLVAFVDRLS